MLGADFGRPFRLKLCGFACIAFEVTEQLLGFDDALHGGYFFFTDNVHCLSPVGADAHPHFH